MGHLYGFESEPEQEPEPEQGSVYSAWSLIA